MQAGKNMKINFFAQNINNKSLLKRNPNFPNANQKSKEIAFSSGLAVIKVEPKKIRTSLNILDAALISMEEAVLSSNKNIGIKNLEAVKVYASDKEARKAFVEIIKKLIKIKNPTVEDKIFQSECLCELRKYADVRKDVLEILAEVINNKNSNFRGSALYMSGHCIQYKNAIPQVLNIVENAAKDDNEHIRQEAARIIQKILSKQSYSDDKVAACAELLLKDENGLTRNIVMMGIYRYIDAKESKPLFDVLKNYINVEKDPMFHETFELAQSLILMLEKYGDVYYKYRYAGREMPNEIKKMYHPPHFLVDTKNIDLKKDAERFLSLMRKSLYDAFEVSPKATEREIKKAYEKIAFKWHPDRKNDWPIDESKICEEIFKKVTVIFSILNDKEKRTLYDNGGKKWLMQNYKTLFEPSSFNSKEIIKSLPSS